MTYDRRGLERTKIPREYPTDLSVELWRRLWRSIRMPANTLEECWTWIGNRDPDSGYGRFWLSDEGPRVGEARGRGRSWRSGRNLYAHRLVLSLFVGIRVDQEADHTCHRGRDGCVSPYHLRAVAWETNLDARDQANGHGAYRDELTDEEADIEFHELHDVDDVPEVPF